MIQLREGQWRGRLSLRSESPVQTGERRASPYKDPKYPDHHPGAELLVSLSWLGGSFFHAHRTLEAKRHLLSTKSSEHARLASQDMLSIFKKLFTKPSETESPSSSAPALTTAPTVTPRAAPPQPAAPPP